MISNRRLVCVAPAELVVAAGNKLGTIRSEHQLHIRLDRRPWCLTNTTRLDDIRIKLTCEHIIFAIEQTSFYVLDVVELIEGPGFPQRTKKLGRMMRRHMKKNMEILSGVLDNHQWRRRVCCKDCCYLILFVSYRVLS
jgi:hypothetical protein